MPTQVTNRCLTHQLNTTVVDVRQGAVLPPIPQTNTTGEGYLIYPVR